MSAWKIVALISIVTAVATQPAVAEQVAEDPDSLYAAREELANAKRAAEIWATRLKANRDDFEAAWKLARTRYWIYSHVSLDVAEKELDDGIDAAKRAIKLRPRSPEGHFWLAANMLALGESFGAQPITKHRKSVKQALERVIATNPAFLDGAAHRVLGRYYFNLPALFGGSKKLGEEHLQRALTYNPDNVASLFSLSELLIKTDRLTEARVELEKVLAAPISTESAPEDREFKRRATTLLRDLLRSGLH